MPSFGEIDKKKLRTQALKFFIVHMLSWNYLKADINTTLKILEIYRKHQH